MKVRYQLCIAVLALVVLTSSSVLWNGFAQQATATQYHVVIDSAAHQRFGLYYPVTYTFQIPDGSSNLSAQYRYDPNDPWNNLDLKTPADFFNGVNAARFDYANDLAYLSVAFSLNSDVIYLRILDGQTEVPITYIGIPKYYDNRDAAVTITLDDLAPDFEISFFWPNYWLTHYHLYYSAGIWVQHDSNIINWTMVQDLYNDGYMEPASHSRSHPCSNAAYQVNGYDWEVAGSRDDILLNLVLQYPYVPVYIEPCGLSSPQIRQAVITANYLVERGWPLPPIEDTFSTWGTDGAYERAMYSYETLSWPRFGTPELLAEANSRFDEAYSAGGIYHLTDQPWQGNWDSPDSNLVQHIGYISNRLNVWYAAFGELYLFHFVQEWGIVSVSPLNDVNESFFYDEVHVSDDPTQAGDILSVSVAGVSTP